MGAPAERVDNAVEGPGDAERDGVAGVAVPLERADPVKAAFPARIDRYSGKSSDEVKQQHCHSSLSAPSDSVKVCEGPAPVLTDAMSTLLSISSTWSFLLPLYLNRTCATNACCTRIGVSVPFSVVGLTLSSSGMRVTRAYIHSLPPSRRASGCGRNARGSYANGGGAPRER